jgi:MYXO-CTERM domain-containing protein
MWDFIHAVETATGKKPLVYTYGSYFTSNGVDTTGLDAYPLYIADPVTGSCFNVPAPWTTAVMWQYSWTGTVSGISGQVDRDKFIGTLAELQALAGTTVTGDAGLDGATEGSVEGGAPNDAGNGPDAGGPIVDAGPRADAGGTDGGDSGTWDGAAPARGSTGGCSCRAEGSKGAWDAGLFALVLGSAAASRRRHSRGRVLAGRSKEHPSCRRPTSARA